MKLISLRGCAATAVALAALSPGALRAQEPPEPSRVMVPAPEQGPGWLGISLTVYAHAQEGEDRVMITEVWDGSPAQEAGLQAGDRIRRVNGVSVSPQQFRSMTQRLAPGDPMALQVERDGQLIDLTVVAGSRPGADVLVPRRLQTELDAVRGRLERILEDARVEVRTRGDGETRAVGLAAPTIVVERVAGDSIITRVFLGGDSVASTIDVRGIPEPGGYRFEAVAPGDSAAPPLSVRIRTDSVAGDQLEATVRPLAPFLAGMNRVAGAELREMSPGLASYFEVEGGLLVTSVVEGTPAAAAGLRGGDVVVAADGAPVVTVRDLRRALGRSGSDTTLQVVRKGESLELRIR